MADGVLSVVIGHWRGIWTRNAKVSVSWMVKTLPRLFPRPDPSRATHPRKPSSERLAVQSAIRQLHDKARQADARPRSTPSSAAQR